MPGVKYYFIGGNKFTISDLLTYQGVLDLLVSRVTLGSKRNYLRGLLEAGKIGVGALTGPGATVEGLYGSQRRRAGLPMLDSMRRVIQAPRRTHDGFYEGLDPTAALPGGARRAARSVVAGVPLFRRRRTVIVFDGKRMSSGEALRRYPNLRERLDGGKGLKERSLRAKLLRYYRKGNLLGGDLRTYEAVLDESSSLPNGLLSEYVIANSDYSVSLLGFVREVRYVVVSLLEKHTEHKVRVVVSGKLVKIIEEEVDHTVFHASTRQEQVRGGANFDELYSNLVKNILGSYEEQKLKGSSWALGRVDEMRLTFVRDSQVRGVVTFPYQNGWRKRELL